MSLGSGTTPRGSAATPSRSTAAASSKITAGLKILFAIPDGSNGLASRKVLATGELDGLFETRPRLFAELTRPGEPALPEEAPLPLEIEPAFDPPRGPLERPRLRRGVEVKCRLARGEAEPVAYVLGVVVDGAWFFGAVVLTCVLLTG